MFTFKNLKEGFQCSLACRIFLILFSITSIVSYVGFLDYRIEAFSHFRVHFLILSFVFIILIRSAIIRTFLAVSLVFSIMTVALITIFSFPNTEGEVIGDLKVAGINVLHKNTKYKEVFETVKYNDFDVVVFSEANKRWKENLIPLLETHYDFIKFATHSGRNDILIASKFPLEGFKNLNFSNNQSAIKLDIFYKNKIIAIYGIHPYSPKNNDYLKQRNSFFDKVSYYMEQDGAEYKLVIGDFNNSPWTLSFLKFLTHNDLRHSLSATGTFHSILGPFGVDIDHILASKNINLSTKRTFRVRGSDHLGVSADVYLMKK